MDKLKWRPRAKIVAIIDAVFASMGCITLTIYMLGSFIWGPYAVSYYISQQIGHTFVYEKAEQDVTSQDPEDKEETLRSWINTCLWVVLVLCVPYCLLEVLAWYRLWTSCKLICDGVAAARDARFWRNVRTVFLVLSVFYCIKRVSEANESRNILSDLWIGGRIFCDVAGILTVQMFISEVDAFVTAQSNVGGRTV